MTSLKGDLRSIMGTPFGGVGHAVLIFSRVTRAAFNSDSVVLQLHDRIEMPEDAQGKFRVDNLDPGPIRVELEGGTVHNHGWNIDLPDEGTWSLADLVDAQVDWSPAVIGRAEAAAREARDHADRAEVAADRVGTAEQVGVWASEASSSASDAASARSGAVTARDAAQSARDAAEGHANRAATSESNAKTSETNAKQSETNAGDYAAVATTAATEAVDAMESASVAASSIGDSVNAAAGHADRASQSESGAAAYAQNASDAADRVGTAEQVGTWAQQAQDAADRIGTAETVEGWANSARDSASTAAQSETKAKEYRDAAFSAASSAADELRGDLINIAGEASSHATESSRSAARAKTSETNAATHEANSLSAAERAEFAAEETIQQVEGDFATHNYVDARMGDYTLREDVPDSGPNALVHSATMSGWPGWGTNRSTANANGDDHSLFLQGNKTATSPRFPITSGEYVFTGSATSNASGSTTSGVLLFRDSAGNAVGEAPAFTADPIILPGWAEFGTTVTVPANTATVELKVTQTLTTTTAYVWYAWLGVRKSSTIRRVLGSTVDSAARAEATAELLTSRLAGVGEPIPQDALATQTGNVLLGGDATSPTLRADYWPDFGHNADATQSLGVPAAFWLHGTTMKNSGAFPIDRIGDYEFTVKVRGQHTGGTTSIRVNYLDADRIYIRGDYPLAGAAVPNGAWAIHTRTITVPEGTKFVSISAWPNHSTGVQSDDYVWYTDIGLRKALAGGAGLRELADTTVTTKASVDTLSRRVDALAADDDALPATPGSGMKLVPLSVTTGNISGDTRPTSRSYRVPVRWGAPILRWRLCITSRNPRFDTRLGADVTMPKITFGKHSSAGGFTEAPTLLATDVVVPGDGTAVRLPWQNAPIEEGIEHILGFDYTGTAEPFALCGGSWYLTDDGDAESLSPGTYRDHLTPFDLWIEAETWATTPVVAAVGDSLTSGVAATFQVLESWLSQYCRTIKALPMHYSASGESAVNWVPDPGAYKITRWRDLARPDAVLWALGSNDLGGGRTFEQARDNTIQGLGIVRDEMSPHIYGTTITPRNGFTPEQNAERVKFNQWILGEGALFRDVFDFSAVVEDQGQIRAEFNGDGVHLNTAGYAAEAASITRPVTTPPVMYKTI